MAKKKVSRKVTASKKVASSASKVLRDGRTGKASKSVAGGALSQGVKVSKKKKGKSGNSSTGTGSTGVKKR